MERYPKTEEQLECVLTQDELVEMGRKLSKETQRRNSLEDEKKSVNSSLKASIDACNAEINRLGIIVSNGKEMREVECETRYNTPQNGIKSLIRMDTGEVIREQPMSSNERSDLFINAIGPQESDEDAPVFVFANKLAVPMVDRESEGFSSEGWESYKTPVDAKELVSHAPGADGLEKNVYRVVFGDDSEGDRKYLLQRQPVEVVDAGVIEDEPGAEFQTKPEPEQKTESEQENEQGE
ncbi:MAG: hypothetical protein PHH77_10905 [Victivallaceae bacterium]|nr:hypothetical protein [Victivallaceae bacterium]